ncbi:MAG: gamma-glutamyl-gamma-aminobutyrate hydrolase family protein [Spirochaetales bacterium]
MTPLIGLTTHQYPRERGDYDSLNRAYGQSVQEAGGLAVLLPMGTPIKVLERLDGLILTGGSDLAPRTYGEVPVPALGPVDFRRDEWELSLARGVLEGTFRIPMLGICRGHQVINVAAGGTLWQDLLSQNPTGVSHFQPGNSMAELHHPVHIDPSSRLFRAFGQATVLTNSFHHQAVKVLGAGLRSTATSADGILEAFEEDYEAARAGRWVLGVQFHPESLAPVPGFLGIFELLVERCQA